MKKNNVKIISDFLSLFNLIILDEGIKKIRHKLGAIDGIVVYDKNLNPVGRAFVFNEQIVIEAIFEDSYFNAVSFCNEKDYGYRYSIKKVNQSDELIGEYALENGIKLDGAIVENKIKLYKAGKLITKCKFDTLRNSFSLYNKKANQSLKYRNNELFYYDNHEITRIINQNGNFFYYVTSPIQNNNLGGYFPLKNEIKNRDYTIYEVTFEKILNEIDSSYFSFLNSQVELVNGFGESLFENLACSSLKNFNKRQLISILGIDPNKGISYHKNKK